MMRIQMRIKCAVCQSPITHDLTRPFGLRIICPSCPNGGHWQPKSKKDKWHIANVEEELSDISNSSYRDQCNSDRFDLADEYDDPIQRAEIRAGA